MALLFLPYLTPTCHGKASISFGKAVGKSRVAFGEGCTFGKYLKTDLCGKLDTCGERWGNGINSKDGCDTSLAEASRWLSQSQ